MPSRQEDITMVVIGRFWINKAKKYKINISGTSKEAVIAAVREKEPTAKEPEE
jgi:post-segregation antitoxin (ccd killing protein)